MAAVVDQIDMFGGAFSRAERVLATEHDARTRELAARLPENLYLGTSSWAFTGWEGLVYARGPGQRRLTTELLSREGLAAYAGHPMLRTVGIDRSYYKAMTIEEMADHAAQVPEDFRFLSKAFAHCTTARFPQQPRYGKWAGQLNPRFLAPEFALEHVVTPFIEGLGARGGVLLFQCPPQSLEAHGGPQGFADRLGEFLAALPQGPTYAVELRNSELLTPAYFGALAAAGALHCLNALPGMPTIAQQAAGCRSHGLPVRVIRWMLALHHAYDSAKEQYAPFDSLVDEDGDTRGEIADALIEQALAQPDPAFLIVNNKAEGSSPLSIEALVRELVQRLDRVRR